MGLLQRALLCAAFALAWLVCPVAVSAHVGAPYPVLLEETAGPYTTSALADPDVGTGTFYVLVSVGDNQPPPAGTEVMVWIQPEDGHTLATTHRAERQDTRYGERYVAKVPFDAEGPWQVRLYIDGPLGPGETSFPVKVTPSGVGWLGTLACLLPFLLLGVLWLRGSLRQRSG